MSTTLLQHLVQEVQEVFRPGIDPVNEPHQAVPITEKTAAHARSQLLVMARLLEKCLEVIRNVEAEGSDEGEMLQALIEQGEAAVKAVLLEGLASNNNNNNADHGHG